VRHAVAVLLLSLYNSVVSVPSAASVGGASLASPLFNSLSSRSTASSRTPGDNGQGVGAARDQAG
jgi:hypothetical protein